MNKKVQRKHGRAESQPLRLGFVPLTDAAPLVMAHELGFFSKYGLQVTLQRELGWATIRDKIIFGELEAAHALAAMPVAATLGLGSPPCPCVTGLVLNLHGNALTLSNDLWARGVRDANSLRALIRERRGEKKLTFGAVAPFSSHHFLLRQWLLAGGISPERDVRIVMVPPPQMVANLKAAHLDGFCVGEPWGSLAVKARVGWCPAVSAELAPMHPEKVLMVRGDFAEARAEEHVRLLAAVLEACEFCAAPENHKQIAATVSRSHCVGVEQDILARGFSGEFDFGRGTTRTVPGFTIFHGHDANEPSLGKASWVLQQMRQLLDGPEHAQLNAALARRVFRTDLYQEALKLRASGQPGRLSPQSVLVE